MIEELHNLMRREVAKVVSQVGQPRWGVVTSTRQTDTGYEARVTLQPEDVLTGWLPILTPMCGNGWGIVAPPVPGQQAFVVPDTGDARHGVIVGLGYSTQSMPPQPNSTPVKVGQFALMHSNGSYLIFDDDNVTLVTTGTLSAHVEKDLIVQVDQNVTATVAGHAAITAKGTISATAQPGIILNAGTVTVNGELMVSGNVSDLNGSHGSMSTLRSAYDIHTHTDSRGDQVSATPNQV